MSFLVLFGAVYFVYISITEKDLLEVFNNTVRWEVFNNTKINCTYNETVNFTNNKRNKRSHITLGGRSTLSLSIER